MRSVGLTAAIVVLAFAFVGTAIASESIGLNAAMLGRGGTSVSFTNEDATGFTNPATLSNIDVDGQASDPEDKWVGQFGYSQDMQADDDVWLLQGAARRRGDTYGIGLGYAEAFDDHLFYAAYGDRFVEKPGDNGWSWGLNLKSWASSRYMRSHTNEITLDAGLSYTNTTKLFGGGNWSFGAVAVDALDRWQRYYNAGVGLQLGRLRLAADAIDVSDEWDTEFNFGAEYEVCKYFTARAGSMDSDLTFGATLKYGRLAIDYGWLDLDVDNHVIPQNGCECEVDDDYDALSVRYVYSW